VADATIRTESQISEDAEHAVIAQTRLSDISAISVLGVLLREAFAPEVAQLYDATIQVEENTHPDSAGGAALDRRMADYGLTRLPPQKARGVARFTRIAEEDGGDWTIPVEVPEGYQVSALDLDGNQINFVTTEALTIAAAVESGTIEVEASAAGSSGNIGSSTLTILSGHIDELGSVTNEAPFVSGADRETDDSLRARFALWQDAKPRTTPSAPQYGAETYEDAEGVLRVHSAGVYEYLNGPGAGNRAFDVFIWGSNGQPPSDELIEAVQRRIDGYTDGTGQQVDGWRPGGGKAVVLGAQARPVEVLIHLDLSDSGSTRTRDGLKLAVEQYAAGLRVGRPFRRKRVFDIIASFAFAIENAIIVSPAEDIDPTSGEKIVAGTITVEVIG